MIASVIVTMCHRISSVEELKNLIAESEKSRSMWESVLASVVLSILLASSLEYPERIRVDSVVETFVLCSLSACLLVSKFSHFSLFHPSLFIQYSTEECSTVQLFIYKIIAVMIDIDTS